MERYAWFALLAAAGAGLSPIFEKVAISRLGWAMGVVVNLFAGCVMVIVLCGNELMKRPVKVEGGWLGIGAICAMTAGFLGTVRFMGTSVALQTGEASRVLPIVALSPVITFTVAFLVLGESISWVKGVGCALAILGAFLVVKG